MKDVTIVVTTFERPEFILECVNTIREFYPDIEIIVSDNGKQRPILQEQLVRQYKCRYIDLPFDCGASRARNEGFKAANTKYAVLCEDDFRFTKTTNLEKFKAILEADSSLGIIGGVCLKNDKPGIIGSNFIFNKEQQIFYRDPVRKPRWKQVGEIKYYYCDYIRMFFMARNISEIYFFDEDFKAGGNHTSGLIEMKERGKWKIGYVPEVDVIHDHSRPNQEYLKYRYRRRGDWYLFYEKTGFRYGVFDRKRVRDYMMKTTMTYVEFKKKIKRGEL